MLNFNNFDFETSVLKFYVILLHSSDIFVLKIKLSINYYQNIDWSNNSLRKLIKLKKTSS